jgi:four helix bundle protein
MEAKGTLSLEKKTVKTFRDLIVWQQAMELVTVIYRQSMPFPKSEMFGLTSQMRRCAVSIPSNIAEGYGRHSTSDYIRFLQISIGSLYELQTQVEIARNLGMVSPADYDNDVKRTREIERMLSSLITKLKNKL